MKRILLIMLASLFAQAAYADSAIAVIANTHSDYAQLSRKQIADIYMGRAINTLDGSMPLPLDTLGEMSLREHFYHALTGKDLHQINAYWVKLLFTGQASPPRGLANSAEVLKMVRKNPNAIGFVEQDKVDATVKVLFIIE